LYAHVTVLFLKNYISSLVIRKYDGIRVLNVKEGMLMESDTKFSAAAIIACVLKS
jgi:hypothetical protein